MRSNGEEFLQLNHTLLKILDDAGPRLRLGLLILPISLRGQLNSLGFGKRLGRLRMLLVGTLGTTAPFTAVLTWRRPVAFQFLVSASETGDYRAWPLARRRNLHFSLN